MRKGCGAEGRTKTPQGRIFVSLPWTGHGRVTDIGGGKGKWGCHGGSVAKKIDFKQWPLLRQSPETVEKRKKSNECRRRTGGTGKRDGKGEKSRVRAEDLERGMGKLVNDTTNSAWAEQPEGKGGWKMGGGKGTGGGGGQVGFSMSFSEKKEQRGGPQPIWGGVPRKKGKKNGQSHDELGTY